MVGFLANLRHSGLVDYLLLAGALRRNSSNQFTMTSSRTSLGPGLFESQNGGFTTTAVTLAGFPTSLAG